MRSYQAITTKYLSATNRRCSRIKATAAAGSLTLPYDDSLNTENAHAKVAHALACKLGWPGDYYIGGMPDDRGYCFVSGEPQTLAFKGIGLPYPPVKAV